MVIYTNFLAIYWTFWSQIKFGHTHTHVKINLLQLASRIHLINIEISLSFFSRYEMSRRKYILFRRLFRSRFFFFLSIFRFLFFMYAELTVCISVCVSVVKYGNWYLFNVCVVRSPTRLYWYYLGFTFIWCVVCILFLFFCYISVCKLLLLLFLCVCVCVLFSS